MINFISTIAAAAFYFGIQRRNEKDIEWPGLMTFSLAANSLISILETMTKCIFTDYTIGVEEIQKPLAIGIIAIVFAAYQSFLRSGSNERKVL